MYLIVDIGNSKVKASVTSRGQDYGEVVVSSSSHLSKKMVDDLLCGFPYITHAIVSSVRTIDEAVGYLAEKIPTIILSNTTPIPLTISYKTPNTLGADRLAAAAGASNLFYGEELLTIDLGTAITIDRVSAQGVFMGGNISPGMRLRFRALHELTAMLPLEQVMHNVPPIGKSTSEAICAGVQHGITHELNGYIANFTNEYPSGKVIFTGGDAKFFAKTIKYPIFVISNLTTIGLRRILEYNAENK